MPEPTPEPMDQPEQDGYELVMPFVVTASHGGPYDDDAFVAGYQAAQVDQRLAVAALIDAKVVVATVYTALVPQMDLIAMHHGYTATAEAWSEAPETWTTVTFERTSA